MEYVRKCRQPLLQICGSYQARRSIQHDFPFLQADGSGAQAFHCHQVVADEQHGSALSCHIAYFAETLLLKGHVSDRKHLIHHQNLGFQVCRDGKCQPHVHPAGVMLHWGIEQTTTLGELYDFIEFTENLFACHAQDGTIQKDVLSPGQFGMKPSANLE